MRNECASVRLTSCGRIVHPKFDMERYQCYHCSITGTAREHCMRLKHTRLLLAYAECSWRRRLGIPSEVCKEENVVLHPGVHPALDLSVLGPAEERIALCLAKTWYLTFARSPTFKGYQYGLLFVKPTQRLEESFHLSREVMVVFNSYPTFDPRTLDFVDKNMFEFQNRLDKLCVIIISGDPQVKLRVQEIALQDKESRLIVPYSYSELCTPDGSDEGLILRRLKEFFRSRDLFLFESPLRNDTYFFGRTQITQQLYDKYKSGQNGCLFGLRKIGKTSVLFAVQRWMRLRDEPVVFLDCSEPAFHRRRWTGALHFMIATLARQMDVPPDLKLFGEEQYDEVTASQCFEADALAIARLNGNKRLLFILDEVENITFDISPSEHWAKGSDYIFFWQAVRSVYQKNPSLLSFIIAGVNPKSVETASVQGFDNPIYRLVTPEYLTLFTLDEVREMVSQIGTYMGLHFDEEVYTYLRDDFGGHPFLTRQACSHLHRSIQDQRPVTVTKFRYIQERERLSERIQDYIGLVVSVLSERYRDEYDLLEYLATGDSATFAAFAEMSPSIIQHLEGYGLIMRDGGRYHFLIGAVQEYIRRTAEIRSIPSTMEERLADISERRNKLERALRKTVRLVLITKYGRVEAKEEFLKAIGPADRHKRLSSLALDDLFSNTQEVYFRDLRRVIEIHWADFAKLFDGSRDKCLSLMDQVNALRVDAHANDIDEGDYAIALSSIKWLQKRVDQVIQ